ncbi:hypothetical protein WPS_15290 [Vulcanimicrobium alpinum]|uniref:N-acetyltransferase domain-containing protein n=1 Tax=Vulcanimicrobium alpinum TaxID=3016050 RepID=A0AAN2C9R8_UNVUL|nr:GNAT family N-acetyltransferase [Vulcanimicrobium alpinum]BDE06253.1 hypothetical protein WPS_15290 [Vulcanimicrobium alpinum]
MSTLAVIFPVLRTTRLRLEPVRPEHADLMFEGLQDPSLYRYQNDPIPATRAALRERYARLASGRAPGPGGALWLNWISIDADGAATGYVQATVDAAFAHAEIGYVILAAQQRRGYAREGVGALVAQLFACGAGVVRATVDRRNVASQRVLARLGFTRVRSRRSDDVIGGMRGIDDDYERIAPARRGGGAAVPKTIA